MENIIGGTYEIIGRIGAGGGGVIYQANHIRLNKKVILKADKHKLTTPPEILRREVDVLKNLRHQYIPQVYDFFIDGETVYTAMDFVEGESLDHPLKRGEVFSQAQVIHWAKQLLEALCYLHSPVHGTPPRGFVHSDIKPANIMRRPDNSICLIDFNIALAIGEENLVGGSVGYASPEHYGLDYSSSSGYTQTNREGTLTMPGVVPPAETVTMLNPQSSGSPALSSSSSYRKRVMPDARSDIYSVGATMYHLLSGKRPAKNAVDVVPLSHLQFSSQLVGIITKAMSPNPDLRFQTADEMLEALKNLHKDDPRTKRLNRIRNITATVLIALCLAGGVMTFVGQAQMRQAEEEARLAAERKEKQEQLARIDAQKKEEQERKAKEQEQRDNQALEAVGDSEEAYRRGNIPSAKESAMRAISIDSTVYDAREQKALTDALGVYQLSSSLMPHLTVELPSEALKISMSPEGSRLAVLYAFCVEVVDCETGAVLANLPAKPTSASEMHFLSENILIYSGEDGLCSYDVDHASVLWKGAPATRLAVSGDGSRVAGVNGDESQATVYNTADGTVVKTVSFGGKKQYVPPSGGIFADPQNVLLALNADGSQLAASFDDGGLVIFDLESGGEIPFFDTSEFTYIHGGFFQHYLAFSIANTQERYFLVFDVRALEQIIALSSPAPFLTDIDEGGIYVAAGATAVEIDPVSLGEREAAYTSADMAAFTRGSNGYTLTALKGKSFAIYDDAAQRIAQGTREDGCELLATAGPYVALSSIESKSVQIMKLETHSEAQVFSYDPVFEHSETRMSADGETVMLFRFDRFYLFYKNGTLITETVLPDPGEVYDQQYRRDGDGSRLEVIYENGLVRAYSAADGSLLWEEQSEKPDETLEQEFETSRWRIVSPVHDPSVVYDKATGKEYMKLEKGSYLTYVTEVGPYLVAQYQSAEGEKYGLLLNQDCETLARMPCLCDVVDGTLLFDDFLGNVRSSRIYSIQELMDLAEK